jgi:hypothetical protein
MKCGTFTIFKCRNEKLMITAIPLANTSYRSKRLKLFRKLHVKSRNYVKTKIKIIAGSNHSYRLS